MKIRAKSTPQSFVSSEAFFKRPFARFLKHDFLRVYGEFVTFLSLLEVR